MKTYNNLFDKITDPLNIEAAIQKAAKGKRRKHSVRRALKNPQEIAAKISAELKTGTWRPVEQHNAREINDGKEQCGVAVVVRYVDDILLMDSNKRRLKKAVAAVKTFLAARKLRLKREPAIHRTDKCKITFIGFVFTRGKTIMNAAAFLRACRTARHIGKKRKLTIYDARRVLSYCGMFKHTNTRKAFAKYIAPNVDIRKCREKIQRRDKACGEQRNLIPSQQ